jgi:exodeoxyribonuclease III
MKIYSWNVNGIRAVIRKELLQPFLDSQQPDIFCLQETKARQEQVNISLPEFNQFWYSAEKPGYSGTALFSKPKPLQIIDGLPKDLIKKYQVTGDVYGDPNKEGRVMTADFDKFYVVSVYTPNVKDNLSRLETRYTQWDPAFFEYMTRLEEIKPVIFCGDINVAHTELDLANPKSNKGKKGFTDEERAGFQKFIDAGFVDTFRMFTQGNGYYTWWSQFAKARERNVGWRIDYILVSGSLKNDVKSADIHPSILGSDHCPISITIDDL